MRIHVNGFGAGSLLAISGFLVPFTFRANLGESGSQLKLHFRGDYKIQSKQVMAKLDHTFIDLRKHESYHYLPTRVSLITNFLLIRTQVTTCICGFLSAPGNNACPLDGRAFIRDIMIQSELTTSIAPSKLLIGGCRSLLAPT